MKSFSLGALALGSVALLVMLNHLSMLDLDKKLNKSYGKLVELHYNGQKEHSTHIDKVTQRLSVIEAVMADNTRNLENLVQQQATKVEQKGDGNAATKVPLQTALAEKEQPSAAMHGRRWSFAAVLGNRGEEIRLPRAQELPRRPPNGTTTWEAPRGSTLGEYTISEIQDATGIDYSVPSSTLVVFHHVTHHAGTYWCQIAKAHYHGAVNPHACDRVATREMTFKGYLIRKDQMPGDHNFPARGTRTQPSKWDKGA